MRTTWTWTPRSKTPGGSRCCAFRSQFKKTVRDYSAALIGLGGFGEVLSRYENYMDLDPEVKDAWGIPVLRFQIAIQENRARLLGRAHWSRRLRGSAVAL